jgi:subtilisin family serine protease
MALDAIASDQDRPPVSVISCSWSVPKSFLLDAKITELQSIGCVVVAAAGNSGISADGLSPVGLNTVIGVGASDAYDRVISWGAGAGSNWGPDVDITAPGIEVFVADMETGEYVESSGTSIATAITAGAVCQFINRSPSLTAAGIQALVLNSAVHNILFRDEDIYGTTPNRLLQASNITHADLWSSELQPTVFVQKGQTVVYPVRINEPLITAAYIPIGDIVLYDWIYTTNVTNGLDVEFTPPNTLATGFYMLPVSGFDINDILVGFHWIKVGVYDTDESELDDETIELYTVRDENNTETTITFQNCCINGIPCPKDRLCCNGTCVTPAEADSQLCECV